MAYGAKVSNKTVSNKSGVAPVLLWKRGYGNRVTRCEIDYFCIGESWKGILLEEKLESEGQR
jgi:hypothetical protein